MKTLDLLGATALALLLAAPAMAQDSTAASSAADQGDAAAQDDLEGDIIVTAAGRAQIVQNVPIAVSVVSSALIENAGITDIRGLRQLTPSLQTTTGQSAATGTVLRIRGIGTAGDNPGFEPAVGVFIDGVFRARAGVALAELPPVDRIEVLRGPQGTLFGRNTSAGALSITTLGPAFDLGGYVEASYGNYDDINVKAGITGPVSDKVALRLDGGYHKRDGYIKDVNTDRRINNIDRYFVRGQALFESEDIRFRLIGDYAKTDEQCCGALNSQPGLTGPIVEGLAALAGNDGIVSPFRPEDRQQAISPNRDYAEGVKEWGVSGELNWDLDNVRLTSVTAYRDWRVRRNQDIDFSGLDRAYREGYRTGIKDFTQEIRLQGKAFDDKLDWLVGGFYLNEKLNLTDTVRFGTQADLYVDSLISALTAGQPGLPNGFQLFGTLPRTGLGARPLFGEVALATNPTLAAAATLAGPAVLATFLNPLPATPAGAGQVGDRYGVKTQAFAAFTHNIINITDNVSLTLGLRYNHEKKDIDANLNSSVPACAFYANPVSGLYRVALNGLPTALRNAIINLTCNPTVNSEFNGTYNGGRSESELTGTAKIAFKLTDNVLLYGGYDHGYKSGGYNLDRATFDTVLLGGNGAQITDLAFGKETVDSYEVGVKTNFSREFSLNVTVFNQDFKNFQDLTFIGNNFAVTPIAKVRSRGVEVESVIRPHRDLTIAAGYTYTDAKYLDDSLPPELVDSNGVQVTNQPKNVVTFAATWTPQLTDTVGGLVHVDMRLNSDFNTNNSLAGIAATTNDGFSIVNARVGVNFNDNRFALEAYVENLFDNYYNITSFPVPEQSGSYAVYPSTPRFYGVRGRVRF
ncbi:MAG: TonB-dependent receptor [Sphingomonas sp. SCN 67-18]|uniref:TonB-dependent receptor n=1 Tax=uncultured Sphingomonas sp. TaxID=158754 RepID=UPI0008683817|nr:TonB-dependent receptor [Sphingomonas sp. SCN 67-18]ODU19809.1 MAG: TonB-dependent receptor [Sphingomonas sp. SCN 67-18]